MRSGLMARAKSRILMVVGVAGALLGGCRTPLPEVDTPPPVAGDGVALVRDMMIEAAKMSKKPQRTEKAVEAVRTWRGEADAEE